MAACKVEVVCSTVEDVVAAASGGADRVEFCSHLPSGGLTPGRALIEEARREAQARGLVFRVLIRPREGDFVYSPSERLSIVREAEALMSLGLDKVVTGGLNAQGRPDAALLKELDEAVGLQHVVFHRAIDEAMDMWQAARVLQEAGIRTVLSSGGAARAVDGGEGLGQLLAAGLEVVAGAGVQPDHAGSLVALGVEGVHASCRRKATPASNARLFDFDRSEVNPVAVAALVDAVRSL
jgi:copper homeostasis protein